MKGGQRTKNKEQRIRNKEQRSVNCSLFSVLCSLFLLFFLLGCSRFQNAPTEEVAVEAVTEERSIEEAGIEYILASVSGEEDEELHESTAIFAEPRFAVIPPSARPGEPVTVGYSDDFENDHREFRAVLLDSRGRRLTGAVFFNLEWQEGEPALKAAIMAVPSTALTGDALIRIESGEAVIQEIPFLINRREFHAERIALDQANTDLRTRPDPQRTAESQQIWAILNRTGREIHDAGPFERPVTSTRRTSQYGNRRVFEYVDGTTDTTIHAGVDYGVPTGTEVRASGAGRVVLARSRILTGNSVVLEHLPGVYSVYYHLDSIAVSEGSMVDTGDFLGASGATGLATGPHLHWEIRVSGENADPDAFLSRPILDKNEILNKIIIEN